MRLLRLSLTGNDASGAFLSDLSRQFSLDVGLVQARVEDIQGVAVGTMFVLVQGAPAAVRTPSRRWPPVTLPLKKLLMSPQLIDLLITSLLDTLLMVGWPAPSRC